MNCRAGRCHHWSEDGGVTSTCGHNVLWAGDVHECLCERPPQKDSVWCSWCGQPVTKHKDFCRIPLRAEIARLRSYTGPDCPRCGEPLKVTHTLIGRDTPAATFSRAANWELVCEITASDLLTTHPEVAAAMGIQK